MWKKPFIFTDRRPLIVALGDGVILSLSLLAAMAVSQFQGQQAVLPEDPLLFLGGSCLSFSLLALSTLGRWERTTPCLPFISPRFFMTSLVVLLLSVSLSYWFNKFQPSAIPILLFVFLGVTMSAGWHRLAGAISLAEKKSILFIGDDPLIANLIEITRQKRPHAFETVGPWSGNKLLESPEDLFEKINLLRIKYIVYSNRTENLPHIAANLLKLRLNKFPLYDGASYYQKLTGSLPVYHLDEQKLLALSQRESWFPRLAAVIKRTADILLTLLLLPLALPILLICALAIKLDSPGPILFIQERLGLRGKPFKVLKLRTMVVDAEKHAPQWCKDNDPRITRVGKVLRKLRLDELPQLLNVLKDDMSLVGPRPIRQHFTDLLAKEVPFYRFRLLAKPGLTGWAQVHAGHANTVANHVNMLQYDLFYLIHQSFWLDVVILCKTIRTVLLGKGR